MRALIVPPLLLFVLAAMPASATAAPRKGKPQRCGALQGRDLLPADREVRLVRVRHTRIDRTTGRRYGRSRYRMCATPRGIVRTVADVGASAGYTDRLHLGGATGRHVVLQVSGSGADGTYRIDRTLIDAATGRATPFWTFDSRVVNALPEPTQVLVEPGGRFGVVYASQDGPGVWPGIPGGAEVLVAGFNRDGVCHDLDAGTAAEIARRGLRLAGSILVWMHGDQRRSQDLATLR